MAPSVRVGTPRFFVSHGTHDQVLPIERSSRRIVPQLEHAGYEVTYREFEGGHTVPPEIALEAAGQFVLSEGSEEARRALHKTSRRFRGGVRRCTMVRLEPRSAPLRRAAMGKKMALALTVSTGSVGAAQAALAPEADGTLVLLPLEG